MASKRTRGGARPGAGRPKTERPDTGIRYQTAEEYLAAVIAGKEPPDPLRIAAAKALLPYENAPTRAKASQRAPKDMRRKELSAAEKAARDEWRALSATVRARHRGA
jgi:hypothetical protein